MELGIVGLPRSGKTSLFGALTGQGLETGGPSRRKHTSTVKVPDERVDDLAGIYKPRKTTHAEVVFVDPGGEPPEAGERAILPEAVTAVLRDVDALVHVVRAFQDPSVARGPTSTSPAGDVAAFEQELILRDLGLVEKRLERLRKEHRPEGAAELALLERVLAQLDAARPVRDLEWSEEQLGRLRGFQLMSLKPLLVVLNVGEEALEAPAVPEVPGALRLCAKIEREIAELQPEEQREFLQQLGLERPAREVFIRRAYELLHLISFFTVGEDEVRAWPVREGATALVAAGKIHSDIKRGFIRAEVIHYHDFLRVGSLSAAKAQGLLRLEGKEYRVRDGEIVHFRFSV